MDPGRTQTNFRHGLRCSRAAGGYHVSADARAFLPPSRAARVKLASAEISAPGVLPALSYRRQTGSFRAHTLGFMTKPSDLSRLVVYRRNPIRPHGALAI